MSWSHFRFARAKAHYVSEGLRAGLMTEASERQFGFIKETSVFDGSIDLPGMIWAHRGYEVIDMPGELKLSIPYSDAFYFRMKLEKAPPRTFADGSQYYKIHGWLVCVVLTPFERDYLLSHLRVHKDSINAKRDQELVHIKAGTKPA